MYLASFLNPQAIIIEPRILNKEQVYHELVEAICRHYQLPVCGQPLLDLILKRDEDTTTAYNSGIAIPHIRMEGFQDTVVGMALLQNPIEIDGMKVRWVVLIITDKTSSKLYLNMVASLLKLSKDEQVMQTLFSAHDGHGVITYLKQMGVEVKKEISIADIMISDPVTIKPQATLYELNNLMRQHGIAGLPVVDDKGSYLGDVNILDVLKVGIPEYMMMLDNLNFMVSYEPLENLFDRQDEIKVKEIMNHDTTCLRPEASIIEAVFIMITSKKRYMSVVKDGKLIGLVTAMDVLRKVITA